jgi:hypothetical protein
MIYEIVRSDGTVNNKSCVEGGGVPVGISLIRRGISMEATVLYYFHNYSFLKPLIV